MNKGSSEKKKQNQKTRGEILAEIFDLCNKEEILSEKEDQQLILASRKGSGERIVIRSMSEVPPVYEFLCAHRHASLPAVYDVLYAEDGAVVLEEYIDGVDMEEILKDRLYSYKEAADILWQVCDALAILHENGYVHRDIKPENLMIDKEGTVKLIDFDACRYYEVGKTRDTSFLGTVGFASPEQYGIAQSDQRSDIYSLGVLFNIMLTGCHPSDKLAKGKAAGIILRSTQINPEKRYGSVREFEKKL